MICFCVNVFVLLIPSVFINRSQVFKGHSHYVMQVIFNPKDTNTFASVSLDCSIKVSCIFSLLRFIDFCVVVYTGNKCGNGSPYIIGRIPPCVEIEVRYDDGCVSFFLDHGVVCTNMPPPFSLFSLTTVASAAA